MNYRCRRTIDYVCITVSKLPNLESEKKINRIVKKKLAKINHSMSEQSLLYLEQFRTIICRECQYGITKGGIRLHFRRHHRDIPLEQRRELESYAQTFDITETKDVQHPTEEINVIEGLRIYENGLMCVWSGCNHLRSTLTSMKQHCFEEHGWIESKGMLYV